MSEKTDKSIEKQIISVIYGNGRGWAFSRKDFSLRADADLVDKALSRLAQKGTIRRLARGMYDYPHYSKWLQQKLGPDMDQVAHAFARKFAWSIQVSGNAALNIMGISTQVPTRYVYLSDGPSKSYQILDQELNFKKARFTHLNLKYPQSAMLVQAIAALGEDNINEQILQQMAAYIHSQPGSSAKRKLAIAKDTQFVTSWIQRVIQQVLDISIAKEQQ